MTIRERTQRIDEANKQRRQEWLDKAYRTGFKAPAEQSLMVEAAKLLPTLVAGLALLAIAVRWVLEQT